MKQFFVSLLLFLTFTLSISANNIVRVYENNRYGYKCNGSWIVRPIYEFGSEFRNGMAMVRLNGKFGFINASGSLAIRCIYDTCTLFDEEGVAAAKIGENSYYLDKSGKQYKSRSEVLAQNVIQSKEYQKMQEGFSVNDYTPCVDEKTGRWGYKRFGEWVIPAKYEAASAFSEGLAKVGLLDKWGFIDNQGQQIIPIRYDQAGDFHEGLAYVKLYGKYGFVDSKGELVVPLKYQFAKDFENGLAMVSSDSKVGYIDKTGVWFENRSSLYSTFSAFARYLVEKDINEWQKKGKYEKLAAWKIRVTDDNRKTRIDSLILDAKTKFITQQSRNITHEHELLEYDTESEIFLIYDKKFGNLLLPVPINEAPAFEASFANISCENTYYVNGDHLGLQRSVFTTTAGKSYTYDNKAPLTFASIDIDYNFEKIDYSAEEAEEEKKNVLASKKMSVGLSDVDQKIPEGSLRNENTHVLIVSNEDYSFVSDVPFAINDGKTFEEYCLKTLGVPKQNIKNIPNATAGLMMDALGHMENIAKTFQEDAKLIVYYAGHGIPDEQSKDAYLLPVDSSPRSVRSAIKLSDMYASLSKYPTRSTYVFLDACFSGAQRSGDMLASARGVAIKAKTDKPGGNMVVFSAATGDQTAYPYEAKGHGLFSYFLFKKLQETKGDVTLGDLADYLTKEVSRNAIVVNQKEQTPVVNPSDNMAALWKDLKL